MRKYMIFIILIAFFFACKTTQPTFSQQTKKYTASTIEEGFIDCFPPSWDSIKNRWTFCELSAALVYKNQLLVASDKAIPQHSSVLRLEIGANNIVNSNSPDYLDEELILNATKFEDFSLSPDQKYVFLTTGFNRLKEYKWDDYNCLLSWPVGQPEKVQLLDKSERNSVESSLKIRAKIKAALADNNNPKGPEYFKIEGIAAGPNQQLIFGVREMGNRYDDFQYKIVLLSLKYTIDSSNRIKLEEEMNPIYEFNPFKKAYPKLQLPIALSSIEYDKHNEYFYFTTSFEHGDKLGGYLWILDQETLAKGAPPQLLLQPNGEVFEMKHKAEAVSIIDKNTLIIIHDDDRVLIDDREPHQSAYQIIRINKP